MRFELLSLDEDVVGNGVPRVVNTDEQEQHGSGTIGKKSNLVVKGNHESRRAQSGVGGEWKNDVEEPVLELGLVLVLAHATKNDGAVDNSDESHEAPEDRCGMNAGPGGSHDAGEQKNGSEVNDGGSGVGVAALQVGTGDGDVGDEGDNNELQSDEGTSGGADDDVEVFPAGERSHGMSM